MRSIIADLHKQVMAFHKAGHMMAAHEVTMAKLDIEHKRADRDLMVADAAVKRAEAKSVLGEEGGPTPKFGTKSGHERMVIGGGP